MEKPNYYSILTAEVRYDKSLTPNAKLLYSEITCLTNKNGICWASNNYFSELYNVSKTTISKWINQLALKNYVSIEMNYVPGTKRIDKRIIKITPTDQKFNTPQNLNGPIEEKLKRPIEEKFKDNTTSINTTSNNNIEGKPSSITEVNNYFMMKNFDLSEAINFFEYYENNGWKQGKNKMKKWKLAANRWMRNYKPKQKQGLASQYGFSINTQKQIS